MGLPRRFNALYHTRPRAGALPGMAAFARILALALLAAACGAAQSQTPSGIDLGDAPDPTFPTRIDSQGPALLALDDAGAYITDILLGDCASEENQPRPVDDCDDGQPRFVQGGQSLQVQIRRTGAGASGQYWINLVIDLNNDGRWDPENEWLVRNCPVPVDGPQSETVQCPAAGTPLLSAEPGWLRVLVADRQAPESGWDGSAFSPAGEARGEVEDYLIEPGPTPEPTPPTATPRPPTAPPATSTEPPETEEPTTDPETGVSRHTDDTDDVVLLDDQGNRIGPAPAGHRADIVYFEMRWVEIDGQRFLEIRIVRNKAEMSNSSAVQAWLVRGSGTSAVPVAAPFWELHGGRLQQGLLTTQGATSYPGLTIEIRQNGGDILFRIPEALVGDATGVFLRSFDRTEASDSRGFDETDTVPLPPRASEGS